MATDYAAGDDRQGKVLMNVYLAQYKAGWKYTFVYEFTDDVDGAFGFFKADLTTARRAADYLHNFTTILADSDSPFPRENSIIQSMTNRPPCMICSCKRRTAHLNLSFGVNRSKVPIMLLSIWVTLAK